MAAGCGAGSKTETTAAPTTEAAEQAGQTAPQAAEGVFMPLEDLIPEYAPHLWETIPQGDLGSLAL